jgi:hypothetical protein
MGHTEEDFFLLAREKIDKERGENRKDIGDEIQCK